MFSSRVWDRVGSVILLAVGLTAALPRNGMAGQGFVMIVAEAGSRIIGIDTSGLVTWSHSTGSGNYEVRFSRNLKTDEWVTVDAGSVSGLVQTCRIPIERDNMYSVAGRVLHSSQPLPNHPVEFLDTDWNLLQSGLTDQNGDFIFSHFVNGQYFVWTPNSGEYLNIGVLVTVEGMDVEGIDIYVPRRMIITQPADYAILADGNPLIGWEDIQGSVSFSIEIFSMPGFASIERGPVGGTSYRVQETLAEGDYFVSLAALDSHGREIGRGAANFTIAAEGGGGENWVDFTGYMHNNGVKIPNHPVMLLDAGGDLFDEQESDDEGYFVFRDVPFGQYQVFIPEHGGYCQDNWPVMVSEWLEGYVYNFHLMRLIGFVSPSHGSTVPGAGVPIQWNAVAGATRYYLEIYRNQSFYDDRYTTGTSVTRDLPDGAYLVDVMAVAADGLQIGNGTVAFTVGGAGGNGGGTMTVSGYLYNPHGARIPNHPVRLYDLDWVLIGEQQSDGDGKFMFPDVPEQEYEIYCPTHGDYYFGQMRVWDAQHAADELGMPLYWVFQITSPADDSTVTTADLEIRWQPLAGTEMYLVEVTNYENFSVEHHYTADTVCTVRNLANGFHRVAVIALINWTVDPGGGTWGTHFGYGEGVWFTVSNSAP